jgi:SAM-dependent methyltransferase
MDADGWDERYRAADLVWTERPNTFLAEILADAVPGRALDVAAGEGRHAVWLASLGWQVTAVDFSAVGLDRAQAWAESKGLAARLTTVVADVATYQPEPDSFDLALFAYVQLPAEARTVAIRNAAGGVVVGGSVVLVAHDSSNLADGFGGPPDSAVLYTPQDVLADLADAPGEWVAERADVVERLVPEAPRPARDALVVARRVQ